MSPLLTPEGSPDGTRGLAVSAAQANQIKALCDALASYGKRAVEVHLRSQQPHLRGRFCSCKRTGQTTIEQMRKYVQQQSVYVYNEVCVYIYVHHRCFLSGVSALLSPVRSRIVEAVCILLCQKYPKAQTSSGAG